MPTPIGDILRDMEKLRRANPAPQTQSAPLGPDPVMKLPLYDGRPLSNGHYGDPACQLCKGHGFYRLNLSAPSVAGPGHPRYGKLFECECRTALRLRDEAERLQQASALSVDDRALTWGGITDNGAVREAIISVRHILTRGHGWAYLWGPPGPGKTLVLKTAVAETVRQGKPAVFVVWADLLHHLRQGFSAGDYDKRLEAWRNADVLAVDEFGRAKESEWVREAQVLIFNHRYERAAGGRTVTLFSSNFAPRDTDHIEPWFGDRIEDGRFFVRHMDGPSMRPLMEAE